MVRSHLQRLRLQQLIEASRSCFDRLWGDSGAGSKDRMFRPRVRRLEPRLVLNATAELNAIGQLLVMGTSSSETVQLGLDASGDLLLRNETGAIIPIQNHPDGVGFETNPLDPNAITSREIRFELGGSRDLLQLELPSGLDVTVVDGAGDDLTILQFSEDRSPGTVSIDSESIEMDPGSTSVHANGANLIFSGDVRFGQVGQASELTLGSGRLQVFGQLNLSGDVLVSGSGSLVDLSSAKLVTGFDQTTLTIDLQNQLGAELTLGGADDSAGEFLRQLDVRSAQSVSFGDSPLFVAGDLLVADAETIRVSADIDTTVGSQDGSVSLQSTRDLTITSGSLVSVGGGAISLSGGGGTINIGDGALQSDNPDHAVTIADASEVLLGDISASQGRLTLGFDGDIVGDIRQATGTAVIIDRLVASTGGSIDLSNSDNQIRIVEQLDIDGDLAINDAVGDLLIVHIDSRGTDVTVTSPQAILVSRIDAGTADVRLTGASINDHTDDQLVDIIAGRVFLDAQQGIGNLRPLELMSVSELSAISKTGDIQLNSLEGASIELRSVVAGDGAIRITSAGTMIATKVISHNLSTLDDNSRDIELTTTGSRSDILVGAIIAAGDADVSLTAADDILDDNLKDDHRIVADDLTLIAGNQTSDSDRAISLTTSVNDLQAAITGPHRGDLLLWQSGSINLAASDAQDDEIIETSNGQIVIVAGGDMTIADTSMGDDGNDWKLDPEIVARGEMGRIELVTSAKIELQDDVQLHSEKVTTRFPNPQTETNPVDSQLQPADRAVYLKSDTIVFGERIEINTGVDQGVARFFASRPIVEIDRSDPDHPKPAQPADPTVIPAFFDPFTVDTNILEQAVVNDATGILTLDIGREGERGLTVDIDWGAPSAGPEIGQFQQLNGLSADDSIFAGIEPTGKPLDPIALPDGDGKLNVKHFYTQSMILDSRENGRTSGTDPLEVRFAVRHHDSIFVDANAVSQSPENTLIPVPGRVVSSTDNPSTPGNSANGIENGQASFVIPSLSIPVAFFPVRDVIPELETPEFVVYAETVTPLSQTSFETLEASVSSSVVREEYFQIRVLSPNPDGEDLAAAQRLPEDILSGDKMQRMFKQLPDGRYEIQYVLGDGNERSILRVDIRDGSATIPSDALESEGALKLESINDQSSDQPKQPEQIEQPADPDNGDQTEAASDQSATFGKANTLTSVAGVMLATTIRRRYGRPQQKLSAAGRFAARRSEDGSSVADRLPAVLRSSAGMLRN